MGLDPIVSSLLLHVLGNDIYQGQEKRFCAFFTWSWERHTKPVVTVSLFTHPIRGEAFLTVVGGRLAVYHIVSGGRNTASSAGSPV